MDIIRQSLEAAIAGGDDSWQETLRNAELFIITDGRENADGKIGFATWEKEDGTPIVPAYSNLELLQAGVPDEIPRMALACDKLLSIIRGSYLLLDPQTEMSREFAPTELDGVLVALQTPREEPRKIGELLDAIEAELTACFKKDARVKKAYLELQQQQKLVVAIACDENEFEEVRAKADWLIRSVVGAEAALEVVHAPSSSLAVRLAKSVEPFYRKKWLGLF